MIYVFDYLLVTRNSEDLKVIEVKCEVKCEVKKSLQQYNYQHLNKQTRELVIAFGNMIVFRQHSLVILAPWLSSSHPARR